MNLNWVDWSVILVYLVLSLAVGLYFSRRAGRSLESYFLSQRSMPWWLAGVSMVATTFAADTPLAVTGMVARHGVAGNWLWWNFAFSGMLTVFLYARLWRRAEVLTDVEFTEIRYSGPPAAVLRAFRACYLALPVNCLIIGWVTLGMSKVLGLTLQIGKMEALLICLLITLLYSVLSGLWGVVITDFFQFFLAMTGSVALACFAVQSVGGMEALKVRVESLPLEGSALSLWPDLGSAWMPFLTFCVYLGVNWWASWYPGAEPGGGGFIAQRMFAAKDERHSLLATFFFNFAHYALRPWPWILVALAAMVLYPDLEDPESGYVMMMVDHLPHLFRGLLLASFMAAYMSTISTQLNWGASYLMNDLYRRFLVRGASQGHYVLAARLVTILLMGLGGLVSWNLESVEGAWKFLLAVGAGTGPVYLLRWYWWRINAWSEIAAMVASFTISLTLQNGFGLDPGDPLGFAHLMLGTVSLSTLTWLLVTYCTSPEPASTLRSFYRKVRPSPLLWGPVAAACPEVRPEEDLRRNLGNWLLGCAFIFCSLFGIGKLVFGEWVRAVILLAVAAGSCWWILHLGDWQNADRRSQSSQ